MCDYYVNISTDVEYDWSGVTFTVEEIAEFDFNIDLSEYSFTGDIYDSYASWYIQNN